MGDGHYPDMNYKKPPFDLPVVFEDDHFAIGTYNTILRLFLFDTLRILEMDCN